VGPPEMDHEENQHESNQQELVKQQVRCHDDVLFHGGEKGQFYRIGPLLNYPLHAGTLPGPRWHARVFLHTIGLPQGPRIISTWGRSSSGTAALWRPATPSSRSGTGGRDQGASNHTRAGELRKRTNGPNPYAQFIAVCRS